MLEKIRETIYKIVRFPEVTYVTTLRNSVNLLILIIFKGLLYRFIKAVINLDSIITFILTTRSPINIKLIIVAREVAREDPLYIAFK